MSSSVGTICLLILASVAGCSEFSHLLNADPNIEVAISLWSQGHDNPPPSPSRQRVWDDPKIEATYKTIFENAPNSKPVLDLKLWQTQNPEHGSMPFPFPPWGYTWTTMSSESPLVSTLVFLSADLTSALAVVLMWVNWTKLPFQQRTPLKTHGR